MKGLVEFASTAIALAAILVFVGDVFNVEAPPSRAVFPNLPDDEWDEDV